MRVPVIACNTGGVPEIITHGEDGWLVEERSAGAVATAIATLLNDGELRRRLGERARSTVCARFTPQRQSAAAAQRYASLVAGLIP
jgi:glycosyltransferase involved in cell wall biosynthesis